MKHHALLVILFPALAIAAPQAVLRWQADAASPAPEPFAATILQGESIGLECRLRGADIPAGASATFLWQTNGMESAWWSSPATVSSNTVSATWTPTNDVGAASYQFFIQVSGGGSRLYRAFGTLRMRPSPGATPNELPLPREILDFSTVDVVNAPFVTVDDHEAVLDRLDGIGNPPPFERYDVPGGEQQYVYVLGGNFAIYSDGEVSAGGCKATLGQVTASNALLCDGEFVLLGTDESGEQTYFKISVVRGQLCLSKL